VIFRAVLLMYSLTPPGLLQNAWTSCWGQSARSCSPGLSGVRRHQAGLLSPSSCRCCGSSCCAQPLCPSLPCAAALLRALLCNGVLALERCLKIRDAGDQLCCVHSAVWFSVLLLTEATAVNHCCFQTPWGIPVS